MHADFSHLQGGMLRAPAPHASHLACSSVVSRLPGREPGVPPGTLHGRPHRAAAPHRCALGPPTQPPCDLAVHATGVGVSLPHPLGSTGAPPAPGPCRAGSPARASAVQPLSIGSAVSCGLCPVSRRRPSIPQSFRRSPAAAPHRHPRAASVRPAPAASSRPAEALWLRTKPFFLAEGHGVGERTFFPEPKTGSAGSWPALS